MQHGEDDLSGDVGSDPHHIEGLGRVDAGVLEHDLGTTRVLIEEARHIIHLAVDGSPAVPTRCVRPEFVS